MRRKPKPKMISEKRGTTRLKGKSGSTITVKQHKTKESAEKHARKQFENGKVSVIGKRSPYLTFTSKGPKLPKRKAKKKPARRKRKR